MAAYLIVNYDVTDPDGYRSYQKQAGPIMEGGKLLVLDAASERLEGDAGAQTVVIEYPDRETALKAYRSDAYQAVVGIRHDATAKHRAMIADGR